MAQVFKTYHMPHTGKLSLARVLAGKLTDGMALSGSRVGGIARLKGHEMTKLATAGIGEVVALARMDDVATGRLLSSIGQGEAGGALAGAGWPRSSPWRSPWRTAMTR